MMPRFLRIDLHQSSQKQQSHLRSPTPPLLPLPRHIWVPASFHHLTSLPHRDREACQMAVCLLLREVIVALPVLAVPNITLPKRLLPAGLHLHRALLFRANQFQVHIHHLQTLRRHNPLHPVPTLALHNRAHTHLPHNSIRVPHQQGHMGRQANKQGRMLLLQLHS
jgi:hypothetical protein